MNTLKVLLTTCLSLLILDALWLGVIAKQIYFNALGDFFRMQEGSLAAIWWAAVIVYVLLNIAILVFIVPKANGSVLMGLAWGALLGLIMYGVYDFTNLALIKHWPAHIAFIDTLWGAVICGISSALAVWVHG